MREHIFLLSFSECSFYGELFMYILNMYVCLYIYKFVKTELRIARKESLFIGNDRYTCGIRTAGVRTLS